MPESVRRDRIELDALFLKSDTLPLAQRWWREIRAANV